MPPWNKGKLVGQKLPLKLKEIWAIRIRLGCVPTPSIAADPRHSMWPRALEINATGALFPSAA